MGVEKKRRSKRQRCSIAVDFSVYATKKNKGTTHLKNVSEGGLNLSMKRAPEVEAVIVINGDRKRLSKYIDFDKILLDTNENPIVRVVHVARDKKKKMYSVGVRFLERPSVNLQYGRLASEVEAY